VLESAVKAAGQVREGGTKSLELKATSIKRGDGFSSKDVLLEVDRNFI
jgi:hypothetical protein